MKQVQSYMAVFLALMVLGCGGSGGSGAAPVLTSNLSTPAIEAIVRVERNNLMHPNSWTDAQLLDPTNQALKADLIVSTVFGFQDPTDFQTGEEYVFQLAAYTSTGTRVVLPATFQTQDLSFTYGNLGSNSGVFTASDQTTTTDQVIQASYNGITYSAKYDIRQRQARLLGQALYGTTNTPVAGSVLDFYDPNGAVVGTVTTASDGTFRASVPQNSAAFSIDPHTLPTTAYGVFSIDGLVYAAGSPDCRAPLPGLVVGTQSFDQPVYLTTAVAGQAAPATSGCPSTSIVLKR